MVCKDLSKETTTADGSLEPLTYLLDQRASTEFVVIRCSFIRLTVSLPPLVSFDRKLVRGGTVAG